MGTPQLGTLISLPSPEQILCSTTVRSGFAGGETKAQWGQEAGLDSLSGVWCQSQEPPRTAMTPLKGHLWGCVQ